jgi:hypothetical protein
MARSSGYRFYARNPQPQQVEDPRRHLDARMNELLDELYKIPRFTPADGDLAGPNPHRDLGVAPLLSIQVPDHRPANKTRAPDSDLAPITARARGRVRDLPSLTPSDAITRGSRNNAG